MLALRNNLFFADMTVKVHLTIEQLHKMLTAVKIEGKIVIFCGGVRWGGRKIEKLCSPFKSNSPFK